MSSSYAQGCVTRCWKGRVPRETDNIQPQEAGGWNNVIKLCTRLCNKMLEWESAQGEDNIQPLEAGGWNVIKLCTRLCNKVLEWESAQGEDNIQRQEAGGWNVIKLCMRLCNKMLEWESVQGDGQHSATGGRRMECHQVMHKAV